MVLRGLVAADLCGTNTTGLSKFRESTLELFHLVLKVPRNDLITRQQALGWYPHHHHCNNGPASIPAAYTSWLRPENLSSRIKSNACVPKPFKSYPNVNPFRLSYAENDLVFSKFLVYLITKPGYGLTAILENAEIPDFQEWRADALHFGAEIKRAKELPADSTGAALEESDRIFTAVTHASTPTARCSTVTRGHNLPTRRDKIWVYPDSDLLRSLVDRLFGWLAARSCWSLYFMLAFYCPPEYMWDLFQHQGALAVLRQRNSVFPHHSNHAMYLDHSYGNRHQHGSTSDDLISWPAMTLLFQTAFGLPRINLCDDVNTRPCIVDHLQEILGAPFPAKGNLSATLLATAHVPFSLSDLRRLDLAKEDADNSIIYRFWKDSYARRHLFSPHPFSVESARIPSVRRSLFVEPILELCAENNLDSAFSSMRRRLESFEMWKDDSHGEYKVLRRLLRTMVLRSYYPMNLHNSKDGKMLSLQSKDYDSTMHRQPMGFLGVAPVRRLHSWLQSLCSTPLFGSNRIQTMADFASHQLGFCLIAEIMGIQHFVYEDRRSSFHRQHRKSYPKQLHSSVSLSTPLIHGRSYVAASFTLTLQSSEEEPFTPLLQRSMDGDDADEEDM